MDPNQPSMELTMTDERLFASFVAGDDSAATELIRSIIDVATSWLFTSQEILCRGLTHPGYTMSPRRG